MESEAENIENLRRMDPRLVLTKIYTKILDNPGAAFNIKKLVALGKEAGLPLSETRVGVWIRNYRATGTISKESGLGGRPRLLDESQVRLFVGYILDRYQNHQETHLSDVKIWIEKFLKNSKLGGVILECVKKKKIRRKKPSRCF